MVHPRVDDTARAATDAAGRLRLVADVDTCGTFSVLTWVVRAVGMAAPGAAAGMGAGRCPADRRRSRLRRELSPVRSRR
ncbi:MAG: hypothetical protein ABIZ05_15280 [Pseudonocardiaceae bacterium]